MSTLPPIGSIWTFSSPLDFPADDKKRYKWLKNKIRYYRTEKQLDEGGFAVPFVASPCRADGESIKGAIKVVLKFPNIGSPERFTSKERSAREHYSEEKAITEFKHIRRRLLGCDHANPIIDFDWLWIGQLRYLVTCQAYLDRHIPLEKWLLKHGQVPKINGRNGSQADWKNWHGLRDVEQWFSLAGKLADALAALHRHRVIHGDIWPPNVFVSTTEPTEIKFIDFGESTLFLPAGDMEQKNHPYRAPERDRESVYVPTELVDVYSFGKLLLYLSTGVNRKLERELRGHQRRRAVRDLILQRNPNLLREQPEILDIIARCTAFEPVDRPTMQSVREELAAYGQSQTTPEERARISNECRARIRANYDKLFSSSRTIMRHLVDQKIREVEALLADFESEMIVIDGSRNYLIRALTSLFDDLQEGDSWTTVTAPEVWQAGALGLDGRYRTAAIKAVRRNVTVSRGYLISVEELGPQWCSRFVEELNAVAEPPDAILKLAASLREKLKEYSGVSGQAPKTSSCFERCKRFAGLLASLHDMADTWELSSYLNKDTFTTIKNSHGCFFGLIPLTRIEDVCAVRRDNPASLMYRNDPSTPENEHWLLVMTDIRGRSDSDGRPQLLGFRVYRTVMESGVPHDRIISLERLLKSSINIGESLSIISGCADRALESMGEDAAIS